MISAAHNSKLQCLFNGWRVLGDGHLALDMPAGNCCDMSGAIEIANKVMPKVRLISTFQGEKPDTEYRKLRGKWFAVIPAA